MVLSPFSCGGWWEERRTLSPRRLSAPRESERDREREHVRVGITPSQPVCVSIINIVNLVWECMWYSLHMCPGVLLSASNYISVSLNACQLLCLSRFLIHLDNRLNFVCECTRIWWGNTTCMVLQKYTYALIAKLPVSSRRISTPSFRKRKILKKIPHGKQSSTLHFKYILWKHDTQGDEITENPNMIDAACLFSKPEC